MLAGLAHSSTHNRWSSRKTSWTLADLIMSPLLKSSLAKFPILALAYGAHRGSGPRPFSLFFAFSPFCRRTPSAHFPLHAFCRCSSLCLNSFPLLFTYPTPMHPSGFSLSVPFL